MWTSFTIVLCSWKPLQSSKQKSLKWLKTRSGFCLEKQNTAPSTRFFLSWPTSAIILAWLKLIVKASDLPPFWQQGENLQSMFSGKEWKIDSRGSGFYYILLPRMAIFTCDYITRLWHPEKFWRRRSFSAVFFLFILALRVHRIFIIFKGENMTTYAHAFII